MHVVPLARLDSPAHPWSWTAALAAFGREAALAVLVVASIAIASVLLVLLAFVATPLTAFLVGWLVWRSGRRSRPPLRRLRARWGRRSRIVTGGAPLDSAR